MVTLCTLYMTAQFVGHYSNPISPTGPLSVDEHLKMVREAVWEIRANWRNLGMELGITTGTLEVGSYLIPSLIVIYHTVC